MTKFLKQGATSMPFLIGPFLDASGNRLTTLTIEGTDFKLYKGTDDSLFTKDQTDGGLHEGNGYYSSYLNATDLDTAGWLRVMVDVEGALPAWEDFTVLNADAYDALINGSGAGIRANAVTGTVLGTVTDTLETNASFSTDLTADDDIYNGRTIVFLTGNLAGFATFIDDYTQSDGVIDVVPSTPLTPAAGDEFVIIGGPSGATATIADGSLTAAKFADGFLTANKIASNAFTAAKFADSFLTAAKIATGAFDADALTADAVDAILDEVVEGSTTLRQAIRLLLAALVGKSSGGGTTTVTFRDLADSKNRISATVDANGNRTAVTRDAS